MLQIDKLINKLLENKIIEKKYCDKIKSEILHYAFCACIDSSIRKEVLSELDQHE